MNVATLTAKMVMDVSGFSSGANKAIGTVNSLKSGIGSLSASMVAGAAGGLAMAGGIAVLNAGMRTLTATANAMADGMKWGAKLASEQEQAQVAFATILHSGEQATKMLEDLEKFATATPFDFPQARNAAKQLMAMGIAGDSVIPTLTTLGDIAAGVGVPVEQLAVVFGQVKASGRLMTQDMNQFTSAGVGLIKPLAAELGIAENQVRKFAEQGKISFATFQNALVRLREEDFAGGMEKQSKTALGAMSTLEDQVGGLFRELAEEVGTTFNTTKWINDFAGFAGYVKAEWKDDIVNAFTEVGAAGVSIFDHIVGRMDNFIQKTEQLIGISGALNLPAGQIVGAGAGGLMPTSFSGLAGAVGGNMFFGAPESKASDAIKSGIGGLGRFVEEHQVKPPELEGLGKAPSWFGLAEAKARANIFAGLKMRGSQGMGAIGLAGNILEDIGFAGGRVVGRFGKRSDIPGEQKPTGALQVGSSEAFSAIIAAMTGRDRNSTAKQSLETLKAIEKAAQSQIDKLTELIKAAGGTVVNAFSG